MAECKDVDAALKNFDNAINQQNKRIASLEKQLQQCCGSSSTNKKDSSLEPRVARLESYCNSIEILFKDIQQVINPIVNLFKG